MRREPRLLWVLWCAGILLWVGCEAAPVHTVYPCNSSLDCAAYEDCVLGRCQVASELGDPLVREAGTPGDLPSPACDGGLRCDGGTEDGGTEDGGPVGDAGEPACQHGAPCDTGFACATGTWSCMGATPVCEVDEVRGAGLLCRPSRGSCDPEEVCDGIGPACPPDRVADLGSPCELGSCDGDGQCVAGCPAGETCDTSQPCERGVVDCSLGTPRCVAAGPAEDGVMCRPSAGFCDVPEVCDGTTTACPPDGFALGILCRQATRECDVAESCDGLQAECPANQSEPPGTPCSLGACDELGACVAITHTVSVNKTGSGSGSVASTPDGISCGATCAYAFLEGETVTLQATPSAGSRFAGFAGSADCGSSTACTLDVDAPQAVTASFVRTHTLTIEDAQGSGSGTVTSSPAGIDCGTTCSATFDAGTIVRIVATPAPGSRFVEWDGGGCGNANDGPCDVEMTGDRSVKPRFALVPCPGSETLTEPGETTHSIPSGCHTLTVSAWGAGGGAGGADNGTAASGGGGGYATTVLSGVGGETFTVVVGAGGAGGGCSAAAPTGMLTGGPGGASSSDPRAGAPGDGLGAGGPGGLGNDEGAAGGAGGYGGGGGGGAKGGGSGAAGGGASAVWRGSSLVVVAGGGGGGGGQDDGGSAGAGGTGCGLAGGAAVGAGGQDSGGGGGGGACLGESVESGQGASPGGANGALGAGQGGVHGACTDRKGTDGRVVLTWSP